MCGATSALGLERQERLLWPLIKERLREPGQLVGLMRAVLGGDAEVAVVVTITPAGVARPVAVLATPVIAAEVTMLDDDVDADVRRGRIGDDEVTVLMGNPPGEERRPIAVLVSDWMREHLYVYARELWHRR